LVDPSGYVYVASLGCPKNLVDTEVVTASLFRAGLGLAAAQEDADL
jgi:tRNA A37 methylthiotransferase MiaB